MPNNTFPVPLFLPLPYYLRFIHHPLFIFLLNGATGASPWGFIAGNFGEVVFILALLATERRFSVPAQKAS